VKPIQHRHTAAVKNALEKFISHIPLDGWNYYSENDGVKIYTKECVGSSTPVLRGDGVIPGGFTTYDILSVIRNLDVRAMCKSNFSFFLETKKKFICLFTFF
jgi:hypothetical protein